MGLVLIFFLMLAVVCVAMDVAQMKPVDSEWPQD